MDRTRIAGIVLALVLTLAAPAAAAPPLGLVANNQHPFDAVGTFDPVARNFSGTIGVGGDNVWVAPSPDGSKAYVIDVYPTRRLLVLDLSTRAPTATTPLPDEVHWAALSPDGTRIYMTTGTRVLPVDLTSDPPTVGTPIPVTNSTMVAFSPDGRTAWVTAGNAVVPIDVASGTPGTPITTGALAVGVAVSPDGSTVWVANHDAKTVSVIDAAARTVTATIPIAAGHPGYLAPSPDGGRVWLGLLDEHELTWFDATSHAVGGTVDTGGVQARGLAVTPDGATVFVTDGSFDGSGRGSQVTPVDAAGTTPAPPIGGFDDPIWAAITPDQPPAADFTASTAVPGAPVSFDASTSQPGTTPVASYRWDFGDGATATTTVPTVTHAYAAGGRYDATLTVADAAGTSTERVYTGQQVLRNGGPSARAVKTVVVTTSSAPAVRLNTTSLDFGTSAPGRQAASAPITVTDSGDAPLAIASATTVGAQAGDFPIVSDGCSGTTIAPGGSCTVTMAFKPTAGGERSAQLTITDNASGSPHVAFLHGSGATQGTLAGTVLDDTKPGDPAAAGVNVSVCTFSTRAVCRSATTDANGAFSIASLPAASYQVEILPTGGGLFATSQVVDVLAGSTVRRSFFLHAPQALPSGWRFNGAGGGTGSSFWTSPSDLEVPLTTIPGMPPGSLAGTVVTYYAGPDTPGSSRVSLGNLTVVYWYDANGVPRFVEEVPSNLLLDHAGADDGVLGRWSLALRDAPAFAKTDMRDAVVDGVLTPPANGPYFHGGAKYTVDQTTFGFASGGAAAARVGAHATQSANLPPTPGSHGFPQRILSPVGASCPNPNAPGGQKTPGKTYTDNRLEKAFPDGSRVDRSDPTQPWYYDRDGHSFPQDPNWGRVDPSTSKVDTIFARGDGSGFYVDENGQMHDVPKPQDPRDPNNPIVPLHPDQPPVPVERNDGKPSDGYGLPSQSQPPAPQQTQQGAPTTIEPVEQTIDQPWQDTLQPNAKGSRAIARAACDGPPRPPDPPPGQSDGFSGYVDPSGMVTTRQGVPIAGAKVVLQRAAKPKGKLAPVPNRSTVMSPSNRHNPDRTDDNGHFGWDVIAGTYRVAASHAHCAGARTGLLTIPPPITNLRIKLRCHGLKRTATRTTLHTKTLKPAQTVLTATVRARHGHARIAGVVTFLRNGHTLATAPVVARNGVVTALVPKLPRHAHVAARYQGNGRLAPSTS